VGSFNGGASARQQGETLMLKPDDFSFLAEGEDSAELLRVLPEIRHNLESAPRDEELGLRALLEWPEPSPPARGHHAA
jgi:hypothetical protein